MTAIANHPHPVVTALAQARASIASVAEVPVWPMDTTATTAALHDLAALEAQVAELKARLLRQAEAVDVPAQTGATSVPNWYAHTTNTTRRQAHRQWRLAQALESHDLTRAALAAGQVQVEQAEAVLTALADLPDHLSNAEVARVEEHLLGLAEEFDAKALRLLGRRAVEVVDPDAADAHEAKLLEREERAAEAATSLVMWDDGHGRTHGRFTVNTLTGAALKKALYAIAAPKHQAATGHPSHVESAQGERKPTAERLGAAFIEYVTRYPANKLPKAGGLNATVVVLMDLDTLMGGLKAAHLDTGEAISPGEARRLACEAGIIPAVLGGPSEVLDLGREERFHTVPQRIAKLIEHRGCAVQGCDYPPAMVHLHHPDRWVDGGGTNLDGIPLCPRHHARAHDPSYTMTQFPTGKYQFNRRN